MPMIPIVEIFDSIQGEGLAMGMPVTFVPVAICNLACPWCDTKYSWNLDEAVAMSENELVELLKDKTTVVWTGGEPMLYRTVINEVMKRIHNAGYAVKFHIETNGTIPPEEQTMAMRISMWAISPKIFMLEKLTEQGISDFFNDFLYKIPRYSNGNVQMKFVVRCKKDLEFIKKISSHIPFWIPIIITPERYSATKQYQDEFNDPGDDRIEYMIKFKELVGWCEDILVGVNYRLLPQLHYLIWGGKKGV